MLYPKFPPKLGTEGANILIHAIVPACVVAYYVLMARKHTTSHRDPVQWMLYPIAYTTFIMIRGVLTHHYPYFFFDSAKVGVVRVIIDVIVIGLIYFGAAHLLVLTDRRAKAKR